MQFPSTAENNVNDTSIAVICGLAISNERPSSRHRSESAARTADTATARRYFGVEVPGVATSVGDEGNPPSISDVIDAIDVVGFAL